MIMSVDISVRFAAFADFLAAEFTVFMIPAVLLNESRDCSLRQLLTELAAAMGSPQTEMLGCTRRELCPAPASFGVENHRNVVGLPISINPWREASNLNRTRVGPERSDESRPAGHHIEINQVANQRTGVARIKPATTCSHPLKVREHP